MRYTPKSLHNWLAALHALVALYISVRICEHAHRYIYIYISIYLSLSLSFSLSPSTVTSINIWWDVSSMFFLSNAFHPMHLPCLKTFMVLKLVSVHPNYSNNYFLRVIPNPLFWHSFCHTIWKHLWQKKHVIWHSFWHIRWHSIWHSFWYSFWHLFWHSIWQLFRSPLWHSIWHLSWHIQHPMRSGTRNWNPAAHWALELAGKEKATLIRSRDRYLAGGKKWNISLALHPNESLGIGSAHFGVPVMVWVVKDCSGMYGSYICISGCSKRFKKVN